MKAVEEVVIKLFIATDNQEWNVLKLLFNEEVILDYSSMNGNPPTSLSPEQIIEAWKGILPGFTYTHHQIGNVISSIHEKEADVFCYGTATHFLEDQNGNIWTVVGSYNFELVQKDNSWKISKMKFNFKYQDGNTTLPKKAIDQLK